MSLEEDRHRNGHPWEDAGQNAECRQRCERRGDRPRTPGAAGDTGGEEEGTEQALLPGLREAAPCDTSVWALASRAVSEAVSVASDAQRAKVPRATPTEMWGSPPRRKGAPGERGACAPSDLCPQLQERRLPRGLTPFMRPLWSPRPPLFFRSICEKLGAEAATPAARTPPPPRHAASPGPRRRTLGAKRLPSQCFPVHMPSLGPWEDIIKNSR